MDISCASTTPRQRGWLAFGRLARSRRWPSAACSRASVCTTAFKTVVCLARPTLPIVVADGQSSFTGVIGIAIRRARAQRRRSETRSFGSASSKPMWRETIEPHRSFVTGAFSSSPSGSVRPSAQITSGDGCHDSQIAYVKRSSGRRNEGKSEPPKAALPCTRYNVAARCSWPPQRCQWRDTGWHWGIAWLESGRAKGSPTIG